MSQRSNKHWGSLTINKHTCEHSLKQSKYVLGDATSETTFQNSDLTQPNIGWPPPWLSNSYSPSYQGHELKHLRRYGETLQRYLPVDVYGVCGNLSCDGTNDVDCGNLLKDHYKFYLAFENIMCDDYITEKFFRALRWGGILTSSISFDLVSQDFRIFTS